MEIILLFIVCLNALLGAFVFLQNPKSPSNRLFSLMACAAAVWTFANYMISTFPSLFWVATSYALGCWVISSGLLWTLFITGSNLNRQKIAIIFLIALFFFLLSYKTGFVPARFQSLYSPETTQNEIDWGMGLYTFFYASTGMYIIFRLYCARRAVAAYEKAKIFQLTYILLGASITLTTTAINSFILPFLFVYISKGIDSIGFFFFLTLVTYAVSKHGLFNIKLIALQLITFALWIFLIVRILMSKNTEDAFIQSGIFFTVFILGIILIQTTLQSIRQRMEIENLAKNLRDAYSHLNQQ